MSSLTREFLLELANGRRREKEVGVTDVNGDTVRVRVALVSDAVAANGCLHGLPFVIAMKSRASRLVIDRMSTQLTKGQLRKGGCFKENGERF